MPRRASSQAIRPRTPPLPRSAILGRWTALAGDCARARVGRCTGLDLPCGPGLRTVMAGSAA
jgi:hypothetical protein